MFKTIKKFSSILLISLLACCSCSNKTALLEIHFSDSSNVISERMEEYINENTINYYDKENLSNVTQREIVNKCSIYDCGHLYNIIECDGRVNYGYTEKISQMVYYKTGKKELLYYVDWYTNSALTMWWFRTMALDFEDGIVKMVNCKTTIPYHNIGHNKLIKLEVVDKQLRLYEYSIDFEDKKYGFQIEGYKQTRLALLEEDILNYNLLVDWDK